MSRVPRLSAQDQVGLAQGSTMPPHCRVGMVVLSLFVPNFRELIFLSIFVHRDK